MKKFWMVWNPEGGPPTYKHPTEQSAITEAERLAMNNPRATFVVLEATKARRVDMMQRIDLSEPIEDIPF